MQYIVRAYDGENMLEKRMEVRPRHLENMSKINGKVLFAGGLLDDEGKMKGSDYLASEPYIQEKVWEKVEVEHINAVLVNGEKVGK